MLPYYINIMLSQVSDMLFTREILEIDKMNVTFTHMEGVDDATDSWFGKTEQASLLDTLHEASSRARQQQRSILASFTQPITYYDPLHVFKAARQADVAATFFWQHPAAQHALVGMDTAATIEVNGTNRFSDAASTWRTLLSDAVYTTTAEALYGSGPLFFGGFAFDPLRPRTALWADFPDGLLTLPRLLFSYYQGQAALTINTMVTAQSNREQIVRDITTMMQPLHQQLEQFSAAPDEESDENNQLAVQNVLPAQEWMQIVAATVHAIQQGTYEKVVLARSVEVTTSERAFNIEATLSRLRQSYPGAYVFAIQRGERFFVGATPERLVQAQNGQIQTMALAGSAPRGTTLTEDEYIGNELLHSAKNQHEHAIVVARIREALAEHCSEVVVAPEPQLLKLKNVQHLETPIVGTLLEGRCILGVMANLHPTPAVAGFPREAALEAIRATERLDRGWYAGPLGWIGAGGHGEFAVALRSGLVEDNKATLFAGCGIVADSNPQSEYNESCLKLQAMLRGLGQQEEEV